MVLYRIGEVRRAFHNLNFFCCFVHPILMDASDCFDFYFLCNARIKRVEKIGGTSKEFNTIDTEASRSKPCIEKPFSPIYIVSIS